MNLEVIAAIAEIISSITIVITLIYLAIQTKQTNNALLASSRQATMTAEVELISACIDNPDAFTNMHKSFDEMTLAEREQIANVVAGMLRIREYAWFQYKHGILDESTFRSYMAPVVRWFQEGDTLEIWKGFTLEVDPEFAAYINGMLKENEEYN